MEQITRDRMDAKEFYRMLIDEAEKIHTGKHQFFTVPTLLENIANDFRELCGGKAATDDWKEE